MINRLGLLFLILIFALSASGQSFSAFTSPQLPDEMTINPDQNKKWRKGLYKYSAKPKSAWEVGLHAGHFMIDGDVDRRIPSGFGLGLHLRKALHYVLSIRVDMYYGEAYSVDAQLWSHRSKGGGLVESLYDDYQSVPGWFPRIRTQYAYLSLQTVINIGNILFHKESNKWNWYLVLGGGLDTHQAKLDLFDSNDNAYDVSSILNMGLDHDVRDQRIKIKNEIDNLYDGKYETAGYQKEGIFRIADEYNIHFVFTGAMGIARKINKRLNIALEHQVMMSDNDYLDGMKYRSAVDQTNNLDVGHYTNLRLAINIGNLNKRTEPLYWLNPLDGTFNDIAELKQRPILDLTDSDGDGVVDMMDMEPNSPVGANVDTRGITLDSDGDGIADFEDEEPFSPPGFATDENGISNKPKDCCITKEEVQSLIDVSGTSGHRTVQGNADWFLPMIHYDLDKYYIKPEFFGQLKHVADMMKKYPGLCVTAHGHTDIRNSNAYNEALSYKRAKSAIDYLVDNYGISRDRFKLMYGGEEMPIVSGLPDHHNITKELEMKQYMNRRVEFRTCLDTDFEMPAPMNIMGGKSSYGSSRKGSKYSGNKNSGY